MTATTFAAALQICGLRLEQAADYLGVDLAQVDAWITGEASPPLAGHECHSLNGESGSSY